MTGVRCPPLAAVAEVEGRLHDADEATVHLHELGGQHTLVVTEVVAHRCRSAGAG